LFHILQLQHGQHRHRKGDEPFGGANSEFAKQRQVLAVPQISFDTIQDVCENASLVSLNASPSGGAFSGVAVTGNSFDPTVAGAGNYEIIYTYTGSNGCTAVDTNRVVVNPLPVVSVAMPDTAYCAYDTLISVSVSPSGGVLSGAGITGQAFNPMQAASGSHKISYTYVDSNGCQNGDSMNIQVYELPVIDIGADTSIGLSESLIIDAGPNYQSYLWYDGSSAQSVVFQADSAGAGDHNVYLVVENAFGCQNSDSVIVEVFDDTGVEISASELFRVYPNPFVSSFILDFMDKGDYEIYLLSSEGRLIEKHNVKGQKRLEMAREHLSNGLYMLKIVNDKQVYTIKLIKSE
ncbi:MAG: T9SS type A sorting domain-containing protein, partial [Bacteroidales bacterium]